MTIRFALLLTLPLAACVGAAPPATPGPQLGSDRYDEASVEATDPLVTALHEGDYLWQCNAPTGRDSLWQFMIRNAANETGSELLLQTPGNAAVTNLSRSDTGDTAVFSAAQGSISIDPHGRARFVWNGTAQDIRCHKGEQPQ